MSIDGGAFCAGVIGRPIKHSLSPRLMGAWIDALGLNAAYVPFAPEPGQFTGLVKGLAGSGWRGVNVTLPFKEEALALADEATPSAKSVGAANLLTFCDGRIIADNTDVPGFLACLDEAGFDLASKSALVLGAGGASRAILHALDTAGADQIILTNRTRQNAETLASSIVPEAKILDWDDRASGLPDTDLVINVTALGLPGNADLSLDFSQAGRRLHVLDTVYTPLQTGLLKAAARHGHTAISGLGMLIGQARPSFQAFFGQAVPQTVDARALLVEALVGEET